MKELFFNMKRYVVDFESSNGKFREIGEALSLDKAVNIVEDFLQAQGFEVPYIRMWQEPENNKYMVDVGSHTEFFHIYYAEVSQFEEE